MNKGNIILENCSKINLKDFGHLKKKKTDSILKTFKKFIYSSYRDRFFLAELEIFNLRNDRYLFIDRIINLLIIKEIIKRKKINKLKIVSDNTSTLNIFDNINLVIEKKNLGIEKHKNEFILPKIIKFYIKTFFFIFFMNKKKKLEQYFSKNAFYLCIQIIFVEKEFF